MKATRIRDNEVVSVEKSGRNLWTDIDTKEIYVIHVDIELIYQLKIKRYDMKDIFNQYQQVKYESTLYSPLIGDVTFEHTYSCNGKRRIFVSKKVTDKDKYMFEFDEFGRFVYLDLICEEAKRLLFLNKQEYIDYITHTENETET